MLSFTEGELEHSQLQSLLDNTVYNNYREIMMLDKENISKTDLISQYQLRLAERYFPEYLFRSSPPEVFWKKGFLEISQNSQKGFLIFSGGIESERPATLLKKRLRHRCIPVNFVKFLTPFLTEHLWWLRLEWIIEDSDLTNTIGFLMISGRGVEVN